jgi:hypothetical protein
VADEKPSDPIEQQPAAQTASAPPSVINPPGPNTQRIPGQPEGNRINALEDRIRKGELWMIILTAAIAFLALCSVGVGFLQYYGGGEQTQNLINAANRQATAAESFATTAEQISTKIGQAESVFSKTAGTTQTMIDNAEKDFESMAAVVLPTNLDSQGLVF